MYLGSEGKKFGYEISEPDAVSYLAKIMIPSKYENGNTTKTM